MALTPELVRPVGSGSPLLTGRGILISSNSSASPVVLQRGTNPAPLIRIRILAVNVHAGTSHTLYVMWGGTTDPGDIIPIQVRPEQGPQEVIPPMLIRSDLIVQAYADTINKIVCFVELSSP